MRKTLLSLCLTASLSPVYAAESTQEQTPALETALHNQQEPSVDFVDVVRGHTGSWYNPATAGEGANLEVMPNGDMAFYYYTYLNGEPIFFTGILEPGLLEDFPNAMVGRFFISTGGDLLSPDNPENVLRVDIGLVAVGFYGCNTGLITFLIDGQSDTDDVVNHSEIQRLTPGWGCDG